MRILLIIIAFGFLNNISGQSTQLYDMQISGPLTLERCLDQLKHQYKIEFSYPSTLAGTTLDPAPLRSTIELNAYLKQIFLPAGIEFQALANRQVLLRTRDVDQSLPAKEKIISGKVIDAYSGEAITYALVTFNEYKAYAYSDENGAFSIKIPKGESGQLKFHSLGYLDQEMAIEQWKNGQQLKLNLNESYFSEITVLTPRPALVLSSKDLGIRMDNSVKGLSTVGGIFSQDPLRRLQLLAGVNGLDDLSAAVKIRGSSGDATLLLVDGIPIYRAEHYYGIFSGINGDYIDELKLYKNNLPVQYGGRVGGMVKMESQPELQKLTGKLSANLLESSAAVDVPLGKSLGLSLASRASYLGLTQNNLEDLSEQNSESEFQNRGLARKELLQNDPDFNYWDANGKFYLDHKKQHLEVNFYQSKDNFKNSYINQYRTNRFVDAPNVKETFSQTTVWENQGVSANYTLTLKDWDLNGSIYQTTFNNSDDILSSFELDRIVNPIDNSFEIKTRNSIFDQGGQVSVERKFDQLKLMVGLERVNHEIEFEVFNNNRADINQSRTATENTLFANIKYEPIEDLVLNLAGRGANYQTGNFSQWAFSPQVDLKYYVNGTLSFKAAAGRHYQFVREADFENRFGQSKNYFILANEQIPIGYANKFMAGFSLLGTHFSADVEFFYKDLEGLLEFGSTRVGFRSTDLGANPVNDYQRFEGTGEVKGVDFGINYQKENWTQQLAYTLSEATNQFPGIYQNTVFPSREDSRHQFQYSSKYKWQNFSAFGTYVFGSGRPYTDLSKILEETDRRNLDSEEVISRLPDYHRVDCGVDYQFSFGKSKASVGLSVFNLLNRENVKYVQYIYALPNLTGTGNANNEVLGIATNQLDRTFSLNFSIEF